MKAVETIPYTLYKGTFIDTPELGELRIRFNCLVGVNQQGVIDFIKEQDQITAKYDWKQYTGRYKHEKEREADIQMFLDNHGRENYFNYIKIEDNKFIFPGFIDTHIHSSQYPNVGIGLNIQLLDWLKIYTFPLENSFKMDNLQLVNDIYTKIIKKTLGCGTTCASYFTTIDNETSKIFGDLLLSFGQRGFVGKVCMNHNDDYPEYQQEEKHCVEDIKHLKQYFDSKNPDNEDLVKPIITPRFAPVCSRSLLTKLGKLSQDEKLPIQTHISENKGEIDLVKKLFPECSNYANVYDNHNLLQESTILAHAIHLSKEECKLIKEKNCSISHCPTSNTFIASGEAPVKKYLYHDKINVSLGTDISGGWDPSILSIIRQSILVSHHLSMKSGNNFDKLSLNDGLFMSTQGGAIAVGLQETIGTFDIGKRFDSQVIDLQTGNLDLFHWQLVNDDDNNDDKKLKMLNLLNKWVFCGDDRNCSSVFVNGRKVVSK
ncbi:probable guanine deaminase [[Candida] jaroonii]|uniref:Probable guanine deaminase n=1 Tax=[Candida] jaroonii TaxID=467808 RepID=A0ACA9YGD0_9ASCO|nr:probable guanine deaminase [[Candida] jaroonii]